MNRAPFRIPPPADWQGAEKQLSPPPPPLLPPDDEDEAAAVAWGSMLGMRLAAWLASHTVVSPISGPPCRRNMANDFIISAAANDALSAHFPPF
jgi:hypothetical protein